MTASRSVSSSGEVATDPLTAFTAFTEEIDCWWVQGPINFYDSARAYSARIEPGVGGRAMEIYDEYTGDGLEVARITAWEPGARLAWGARSTTLRQRSFSTRSEPGPWCASRPPSPEAARTSGARHLCA